MKNGSKNPLPLTILKPGFYKIMLKKLWSEGQETPISDHWQIEDRGGYHGEDEQEYWQSTTPWSPNTKGLARITFSAPTKRLALSNKPRRTHWWRDKSMKRDHFSGFPGGAVVEGLPANAGDTGSSPGLGRSHMPRKRLGPWATTTEPVRLGPVLRNERLR